MVRLLLEKGAYVNAEGEYHNVLVVASYNGHENLLQLLLDNGADVNAQSGKALQKASENGQQAIMRLLLKNKADVNLVFHDDTSLQGVSVDDHEVVIQLLMKENKPLKCEDSSC